MMIDIKIIGNSIVPKSTAAPMISSSLLVMNAIALRMRQEIITTIPTQNKIMPAIFLFLPILFANPKRGLIACHLCSLDKKPIWVK
jgi:hypothetical protein